MLSSPQESHELLERVFVRAGTAFFSGEHPAVSQSIETGCDVVFASKTKAYREVLLGCLVAKITNPDTDIHLPYVSFGPRAFSGRTLDEKVVNPFLRKKNIPSTRGAYLSCFRRSVKFQPSTSEGLKDKQGYDVLLTLLDAIDRYTELEPLFALLEYVLYRFVEVREQIKVELITLDRVSLTQYGRLVRGLLSRPSGGIFPVVLVLAMVETIVHRFSLGWQVVYQGINIPDRPSGAAGDISVRGREKGNTILTIEVTERPVDVSRVRATFTEKIAPAGVHDYIFLLHLSDVSTEAKQLVERYFAQGYDVNFVDIQEWLVNTLVTVGVEGRAHFQERMLQNLSGEDIPKALKVAWNEEMGYLLA